MALEPFLLDLLVCPETRLPLRVADDVLVQRMNAAIDKEKLKDRRGQTLAPKLQTALVRADGVVAYPVWDDVPRLLVDAGILLEQLS
ncbi:MAG: hypothetical protein FJ137_14080 [Deltaproteobacteria bacterium]|nr:hypothetical protein [Deltaproteobacteria bacterium]